MELANRRTVFSKHRFMAFIMSLCMIVAILPVTALAADIPLYRTLDDIPEDVNVFRSIRTGTITYLWANGDLYYQFAQEGYPTVRIKASAFMTFPKNNYLDADNFALSKNCKDSGGTSRVCYYKSMKMEWKSGDVSATYTSSMYRLELIANADLNGKLRVESKLTSGITFQYKPGESPRNALKRLDKLPLRPSVSVRVANDTQDVHFTEYKITHGFGSYSEVSSEEAWTIGANSLACIASIAGIFLADPILGKVVAGASAAATCVPAGVTAVKYSNDRGYHSESSIDYTGGTPVTLPVKLAHSDNYVRTEFELNRGDFDKSNTHFVIVFSFDCFT